MKVVIAKTESHAPLPTDFNHATRGEFLTLPALVCEGPKSHRDKCGCGRAFGGVTSGLAVTYGVVADADEAEVIAALESGSLLAGWADMADDDPKDGPRQWFLRDLHEIASAVEEAGIAVGTEVRIKSSPTTWALIEVLGGPSGPIPTAPTGAEEEAEMPSKTTPKTSRPAKPDPKKGTGPAKRTPKPKAEQAAPAAVEAPAEETTPETGAAAETAEQPAATAVESSASLSDALIALVKHLHPTTQVEVKKAYLRLTVGGKTVAYLNGGKRALTVDVPLGSGGLEKVKVAETSQLPAAVKAINVRVEAVSVK